MITHTTHTVAVGQPPATIRRAAARTGSISWAAAGVLWRAIGEAGAMALVTPPTSPQDPSVRR